MNSILKKFFISSISLMMFASIGMSSNYNLKNVSASRYSYKGLPRRTRSEVNSFYRYAKMPAIKYSPSHIKKFYRNGAHQIYMYEKNLSKTNHNIRHTNWLIRRYKRNHHYVRQLKKRIKSFQRQVKLLSQRRYELLYAERGTYSNYKNKYNHEAINTPYDVENSAPKLEMLLGKKDANGIFGGGTSYEYAPEMEHRRYLLNSNYREAFIDNAESYGYSSAEAINVLNAFQRYQANSMSYYNDGWNNGLYDNQDENLTDSNEATKNNFQSGWHDGDIVNNDGDLSLSKSDFNNFKDQVNQEHPSLMTTIRNYIHNAF